MTISMNSVFTHFKDQKNQEANVQHKDLKKLLENVLKEKGEYEKANLNWIDDETVEVTDLSGLAIHSFVLRAEELGKNISFEKKTIVKITD